MMDKDEVRLRKFCLQHGYDIGYAPIDMRMNVFMYSILNELEALKKEIKTMQEDKYK